MTTSLPSNVQTRMRLYDLDPEALSALARAWPMVERVLAPTLERFLAIERANPAVRDLFERDGAAICRLEQDHLGLILSGRIDEAYFASCNRLSAEHERMGLYARTRLLAGNMVLRAVLDEAARRHRFSGRQVAALGKLVANALDFDIAITMTVQADAALRASEARREAVERSIGEFEPTLGRVVAAVKAASEGLAGSSADLRASATETARRMSSAARIAGEIAIDIDNTAAATEQLAHSITEIGVQSDDSLRLAQAAAEDSRLSKASLDALAAAADRIGSVVELISKIAAQTNLLALNATIEAARAGEAGRGFAVVAAEVKALAGQTAEATSAISRQIAAIQEATGRSVGQIERVGTLIGNISAAATVIAASVEEQGAATRSISEGIRRIAATTSDASADVKAVEQESGRELQAAETLVTWTGKLSGGAGDLERDVAQFFGRVRATG